MTHDEMIENLEKAQDTLKMAGYAIHSCVAKYAKDDVQFVTRINTPGDLPEMTADHAFSDAVRELSINWHNATHTTKVIW